MKKYCFFAHTLMLIDIAVASSIVDHKNDSTKQNTTEILTNKVRQEPFYSIIKTSSLDRVKEYIKIFIEHKLVNDIYNKDVSAGTYVIFDIDKTLLHVTSANLSAKYFDEADCVFGQYKNNNNYDEKKMDKIHRIIHEQVPEILVDNEFPDFIKDLQENGVKTMAITAIHNFDFDGVNLLDIRFNKLKKLGIDFSKSYPALQPCCINNGLNIHYSSGIISSANCHKGLALTMFFKYNLRKGNDYVIKPRQIIFLDDWLNNVLAMGQFCKDNNVNYIGFHYTAGNYLKFVAHYNAVNLYYQIMIADKESRLLNDNEIGDYISSRFAKHIKSMKHRIFQEFLKKLKSKIEAIPGEVETTTEIVSNETDNSK